MYVCIRFKYIKIIMAIKQLTKAEEQIMMVLWTLKKAFVKEILEELSEPKPHYNTASTIIKILIEKGVVDYKAYGKTHQYYPLISKEEYSKRTMKGFVNGYFDGSYKGMLSFFVKEKQINLQELEELINQLKSNKK
jgi:BlaI family penicillinase repressor